MSMWWVQCRHNALLSPYAASVGRLAWPFSVLRWNEIETVSTRGGHYIHALHEEEESGGDKGAGPNHPVERTSTFTMSKDIKKELEVLYQPRGPIIPFWLFGP